MGDSGEGLIDADARIQERMEELERERTRQQHGKPVRDPVKMQALESLRLARTELDRQLVDDQRTAPHADCAGHRRDQPPHGGHRERRQGLTG